MFSEFQLFGSQNLETPFKNTAKRIFTEFSEFENIKHNPNCLPNTLKSLGTKTKWVKIRFKSLRKYVLKLLSIFYVTIHKLDFCKWCNFLFMVKPYIKKQLHNTIMPQSVRVYKVTWFASRTKKSFMAPLKPSCVR